MRSLLASVLVAPERVSIGSNDNVWSRDHLLMAF